MSQQFMVYRYLLLLLSLLLSLGYASQAAPPALKSVRDSIVSGTVYLTEESVSRYRPQLEFLKESGMAKAELQYCCGCALNNMAAFMIERRLWYACPDILTAAEAYCSKDSLMLRDELTTSIGCVSYLSGDFSAAEKAFLQNVAFLKDRRSLQDREALAKTYVNLGEIYRQTGHRGKAMDCFSKALEISTNMSDKSIYVDAIVHAEKMEEDSYVNVDMLKSTLSVASKGNLVAFYPSVYLALARFYFRQNDDKDALSCAEKGLEFAVKNGQSTMLKDLYGLMSKIYAGQKDYSMAYFYSSRLLALESDDVVRQDRRASKSIQMAEGLMLWCLSNVPAVNEDKAANLMRTSPKPAAWMWIMLAVLVIAAAGCAVFAIKKSKAVSHLVARLASFDADAGNGKEEELRSRISTLSKEILWYETFHTSVNPLLQRIRDMIKDIKPSDPDAGNKVKSASRFIMQNLFPRQRGEALKIKEQLTDAFVAKMAEEFPDLTQADRRLLVQLSLGLSSQEISIVTGHSLSSINQARHRLRKALRLATDDNLEEFVARKSTEIMNKQMYADNHNVIKID